MSGSVTAAEIVHRLNELRRAIAEVQINGRPLGSAVRYEPAASAGDPIEVNIAPPEFKYEGNCLGPTGMIIDVYVVAVSSDITVLNLIQLERGVADAIDMAESNGFEVDATVTGSQSGIWNSDGVDHPAYVINCEVGI